MLQWGRNLIVAEGHLYIQPGQRKRLLQWGRNLIVAEGPAAGLVGAMDMVLQWGRNLIVAEGTLDIQRAGGGTPASMGPQLDSCGRASSVLTIGFWARRFNGAAT